ncbi:Dihydrolipoyllysine-residue acetyltransferase component of pyruvate dehydrogenase complex [Enhygromyxa salina]|uniref:Dihydrolipoamide acetyltransferase component of pyruvate dehydrogenase complex n=1 Tax=Enhygromyxa salina TaxID=215803 RepID=A0A2S9YCI2_9BACT|nr:dihydrolipoamide acetyltransferase family protein [Enhygromyxa salina]PRQ02809.1 Dihydrolipoyllysine-residue acetyltransferase component of pyruvate dehydrogenase complex [Enhygromyxa salina]
MATVVELPRLSDTMEEGVVAKWRVALGDKIKRGQVIAEIETDKATMEFESFDSGYVLALVAEEGEPLPIGAAIAVLGKQGEDPKGALESFGGSGSASAAEVAEQAAAEAKADAEAQAEAAAPEPEPEPAPAPEAAPRVAQPAKAVTIDPADQRIPASPIARRLAREHGLDLASIPGSGPHGRVIKADVERAAAEGTAPARPAAVAGELSADTDAWGRPYVSRPDERVRLSQMRKAIARRMTEAKQEVPHYYLTLDVDMERAVVFRSEYNLAIDGTKISFNDLIVKAVARALRDLPAVNSSFAGNEFIRRGDVHVGVAVAVDDGLLVPVLRYADQKSLEVISRETRDFGKRARTKQLRPEEMSGGTFTVSNLGMFGIEEFAAVINPGEPGILAVGAIEPRAVVVDGEVVVRRRMKMTISADHRVTDGAVAAQWLNVVQAYLENPIRLLTDPVSAPA